MSTEDYLLNLALIALVLRQLRGKRLTAIGLAWPVGLVALAGWKYLHGIPGTPGSLVLVLAGALTGAVLGCACGARTVLTQRGGGPLYARATAVAAVLWILGVGTRLGFAQFAEHGGGPVIARFSAAHRLTAQSWTAALILMSLAEVLGRTAILGARAYRFAGRPAAPAALAPVS